MPDLRRADLTFVFDFERVNGSAMKVDVAYQQDIHTVPCEWQDDIGKGSITIAILLPTVVTVITSGKGQEDTVVDEQNNIIKDCYAKIREAYLDGFKLNEHFLHEKIVLRADNGQVVTSNYFGFNGTAQIRLDKDSVFSQYCWLNRTFKTDS